jgi:hypothetical protein
MLAALWTPVWFSRSDTKDITAQPKPRPSPVFIGDAMQPWDGGTMLLDILRRDQKCTEDDT